MNARAPHEHAADPGLVGLIFAAAAAGCGRLWRAAVCLVRWVAGAGIGAARGRGHSWDLSAVRRAVFARAAGGGTQTGGVLCMM